MKTWRFAYYLCILFIVLFAPNNLQNAKCGDSEGNDMLHEFGVNGYAKT